MKFNVDGLIVTLDDDESVTVSETAGDASRVTSAGTVVPG